MKEEKKVVFDHKRKVARLAEKDLFWNSGNEFSASA